MCLQLLQAMGTLYNLCLPMAGRTAERSQKMHQPVSSMVPRQPAPVNASSALEGRHVFASSADSLRSSLSNSMRYIALQQKP